MPLYEYQCAQCGRFEILQQKFSDLPLASCPTCGRPVNKLPSAPAIQFKGTGWYITDYARKPEGAAKDASSKDGAAKDASSKDGAAKDGAAKGGAKEASSSADSAGSGAKSESSPGKGGGKGSSASGDTK